MSETVSGWCPPWPHSTDHATCQDRLERGLLGACSCTAHGGHTTKEEGR